MCLELSILFVTKRFPLNTVYPFSLARERRGAKARHTLKIEKGKTKRNQKNLSIFETGIIRHLTCSQCTLQFVYLFLGILSKLDENKGFCSINHLNELLSSVH